jgi:hypothetical protein
MGLGVEDTFTVTDSLYLLVQLLVITTLFVFEKYCTFHFVFPINTKGAPILTLCAWRISSTHRDVHIITLKRDRLCVRVMGVKQNEVVNIHVYMLINIIVYMSNHIRVYTYLA